MSTIRSFLVVALFLGSTLCNATHSRGGEIRYAYLGAVPGGFLYSIEVHLYLDPNAPSDRPEVILRIGNSVDTVPRTDSLPLAGCPTTVHCIYPTTHIFPGFGAYILSAEDPNRTEAVVNIPNSIDTPMAIEALLVVNSGGQNSSPVFNAPVTDQYYSWSTLAHDPQVTEPDGDSLSFELVAPLGADLDSDGDGDPIPGYILPADIASTPSDYIWVDPATGVLLWDQPHLVGYYQVAIKCTERRLVAGTWINIGEVTRDMTICVTQIPTGMADASSAQMPLLTPQGNYGVYAITKATQFTDLRVMDAAGRTVLQLGTFPNGTIDLSRLTSGTYTVVAQEASGSMRSTRVALIR